MAVRLLACLLLAVTVTAAEPMLRQPAVSKTQIAFIYANQVWIAPRSGGVARRVTTTPGTKSDPRFSPDGRRIAFGANEIRNVVNIFTISAMGGEAQRITFLPGAQSLRQWTSDDRLLFYGGAQSFSRIEMQLFTVPASGGLPVRLPLKYGAEGALDGTGTMLAYTPQWPNMLIARWRNYRGGMAPEIRTLNLRTGASEAVTDWIGSDTRPMWHGSTIYYLSDAGEERRMNLWSYDTATKARRQLTRFRDHDVRNPSMGPDAIAFDQAGNIHLYDLRRGTTAKVAVTIPERAPRHRDVDAARFITFRDGELIEARGDLWLSGKNLTATSGVFEREASRSPDGRHIACSSDAGGEYHLYLHGTAEPLAKGIYSRPVWSPDSSRFATYDRRGAVFIGDVAARRVTEIDRDPWAEGVEMAWSADSRWLAYTRTGENRLAALWRYDVASGERQQLTSGRFNDRLPAFDPAGTHLFFLSSRNFTLPVFDWTAQRIVHRGTGVLMRVPLDGSLQWEEVARRAVRVPTTPGTITALSVTKEGDPRYTLIDAAGATSERVYKLAGKKEETVETPPLETPPMTVRIDLHAERRQIFLDAWRQYRDYFFAPNAAPVDWNEVRRRYEPLVARCDTRDDLNEVLAGMIGETGVGHAYILNGGDTNLPAAGADAPGALGADVVEENGAYRITRIYEAPPWDDTVRSPLAGVREGDRLTAVHGIAGKPLTIRDGVTVTPVASEAPLRYAAWVERNRAHVERRSNGRIGYVHLTTFGMDAVNDMARQLYGQVDKEALIVDIRWSQGGWTGAIVAEMLARKPLNAAASRETDRVWPAQRFGAHLGPKALVVNHMVVSAGENFSHYFRKLALGPIIGARTWGGLTGLTGTPPLIDGGAVNVPNAPFFDESGWLIEGRGLEPDIAVFDDPARLDVDAQLDRAIEEMLKVSNEVRGTRDE